VPIEVVLRTLRPFVEQGTIKWLAGIVSGVMLGEDGVLLGGDPARCARVRKVQLDNLPIAAMALGSSRSPTRCTSAPRACFPVRSKPPVCDALSPVDCAGSTTATRQKSARPCPSRKRAERDRATDRSPIQSGTWYVAPWVTCISLPSFLTFFRVSGFSTRFLEMGIEGVAEAIANLLNSAHWTRQSDSYPV
jgi:hypothetical protein